MTYLTTTYLTMTYLTMTYLTSLSAMTSQQVLMDMNLSLASDVVYALIDVADVDGDGDTASSITTPHPSDLTTLDPRPRPRPLTCCRTLDMLHHTPPALAMLAYNAALRPLTMRHPLTMLHPLTRRHQLRRVRDPHDVR